MPIHDWSLLAEATPHAEHIPFFAHAVEKAKEVGLRDFLPGFVGYWLHAVSHNPWHRLMKLLPKALRGGH